MVLGLNLGFHTYKASALPLGYISSPLHTFRFEAGSHKFAEAGLELTLVQAGLGPVVLPSSTPTSLGLQS